jgi:hypothetical protein
MKNFKNTVIALFVLIPFFGIAQVKSDSVKPVIVGPYKTPILPNGISDTTKPAPVVIIPAIPFPDTNIHVYEQPVVKNTIQKIYDYQRYTHGASPGFRVQIDFSQERNAVNKTRADFNGKYPGVPCYITYKQPYFRVSAGDCRKRLDAVRLHNALKKDYPASFIVADRIASPPLQ